MHRKNLIEKLDRYNPEGEIEILDKARMMEFLNNHEDCFERSCPIGHFTGSCWLENHDGTKFLLTLHKKIGVWLQLGGHADGENDIVSVSMREAREESGLKDIVLLSGEIFDIGVHLMQEHKGTPAHYHYDVRFFLKATNENEKIQVSGESIDLRWFDEVPAFPKNVNVDMSRIFKKWRRLKSGGYSE